VDEQQFPRSVVGNHESGATEKGSDRSAGDRTTVM
jgi:hypothetical protein